MATFNIFGSCVCRDIFGFHPETEHEVVTFAQSSSPITWFVLNEKPVRALSVEKFKDIVAISNFAKRCIVQDYNKQVQEYYSKPSDFFITDLVEFARHGVGKEKGKKDHFFTCSDVFLRLYLGGGKGCFDNDIEMISPFNIWNNENILTCMQKYADWITNGLGYSQNRIILIKNKMVNQYSDGKHLYYFDDQAFIIKVNQLLDKMYNTLQKLLPKCHIIEMPEGVYGEYFHKWGVFPLHFCSEYYDYLHICIDRICNRSLENGNNETEIYQEYSNAFKQKIAELKIANQQDSVNVVGGKNYLIGDFSKKGIKDLSLFYGHNNKVSGEWKTINNSTFVILRENTLVLTDNGGSSHVQMNIAQTIKDCEEFAGKAVTFSVDARVLKRNDYGEGGLIAIANAMDYNKGIFYAKKSFHNLEWKRITLSITLPEKEEFKGITVVLRALRGGWEKEPQHAIVEFANPKLEMGIEQTEPPIYSQTVEKDLTVGWNLNMRAVDEYVDSGIHEVENVFQICNAPSYTILFRSNGGSGNMDPIWGVYGEHVMLPKNRFIREGYRFVGWTGYRVSDSKYCYTGKGLRRYFKQGQQPAGWKLHFYKDECVVANLSKQEKDTVILEAQWEKLDTMLQPAFTQEEFINRMSATLEGYRIANRIIENDGTTHYMIMHKHIGDAFRNLKMLILFKNYYSGTSLYHMEEVVGKAFPKRWVVKRIVVVTTELLAGVAKLFSTVDDVIALSPQDLDALDAYSKSFACVHDTLHRREYGQGWGEPITEGQKAGMFVPSYNWILDLPVDIPNKGEWMFSSVQVSSNSIDEAKKVMQQYEVDPNRVVVICPYARSSSMLSENQWMPIVDFLKQNGYFVFTNTGPKEKELKNTTRLQVPVDVFCGLGALGCSFIGVQSGIIDILKWIGIDVKLVCISLLFTPHDKRFALARRLKSQVERRENTTHIVIEKNTIQNFSDIVIANIRFLKKGYEQKLMTVEISKENNPLYSLKNLNDYVEALMQMKHVLIFLSVKDSADKYWDKFNQKLLNLQSNVAEKWRRSYIAVVDTDGEIQYEKLNSNYKSIVYQFEFKDKKSDETVNYAYLSSHAMGVGKYTKSAIVINGEQYSLNRRGLNIVVYSKEESRVIDSIVVDLWADPNLTVKREEDFK